MSIVNRVVDKVYVINMDSQTQRMKKVHHALTANSIEYIRFSAVEGSKVENSKYLSNTCNRFCTDGVKGCALSHRKIWEEMILNSYQSVLILEDDVSIVPDFNEKFKEAWDSVPTDFDILYVGCKFICADSNVGAFLTSTGLSKQYEHVNPNINRTYGSIGNHAYILTRRTAEKFLSKQIQWHLDYDIQKWVVEDSLKSYAMSSDPIQTNDEANTSSSLGDTYPPLLNSVLDTIPLSETDSVSWILGENHFKLFGYNWNTLSALVFIAMLLTPLQYMWAWALWIGAEFLASLDRKNSSKMGLILGIAASLRLLVSARIKKRSK